jgi:ATP phosphoribosyltransferase regulatory subunit
MELDEKVLKNGEHAVFELRALYQRYGYTQYKMSKFEEYDLYVENKDFLVGDGVITFNDTDGKLLALKPDVTLSIIKKTKDEARVTQKVYYNENVYRISKNTHTFKEIMQTGLECIGDIDLYGMTEVVLLAVKSLAAISENYILDLSHLGVVSALVDMLPATVEQKRRVITCIGEKNPNGIREICTECGAEHFLAEKLITLTYAYGEPKKVYRELRSLDLGVEAEKAISELETITDALDSIGLCDRVRIDFSVVNDMNYYSGVVLRGFVDGIPEGILSGGRYDKLMEKMGRRVGAIGFAVYLDLLDRLDRKEKQYDADMVLLYDEDADAGELMRAVDLLTGSGKRVIAEKAIPTGIRYRQLLSFRNGGLEILETND